MNIKNLSQYKFISTIISAIALLLALLIANRWLVLQSDNYSVGRVFQLYISYSDFGFFRRGFFGTLLNTVGLTNVFENDYVLPLIFSVIFLISLTLVLHFMCREAKLSNLERLFFFFSPALLFHLSYSGMGSFDLLFVFILYLNIFSNKSSIVIDLIVMVLGILTHEIFLFLIPSILFVRYYIGCLKISSAIAILASMVLFTYVVSKQVINIPVELYDSILRSKMPLAFLNGNVGYTELFTSSDKNLDIGVKTIKAMFLEWNVFYWFLPTFYAIFLPLSIISNFKSRLDIILFFSACYSPFFILIVASDYYRWVSLSCAISILIILKLVSERNYIIERRALYLLFPFSFFIAFGGASLERPFPLWQNILELFL